MKREQQKGKTQIDPLRKNKDKMEHGRKLKQHQEDCLTQVGEAV